jgi:retrograde regulation protein 2
MPTIFQDRAGISLFDAQYISGSSEKMAIPAPVIEQVIFAMLRFKTVCYDFGVLEENIKVLATEATREAVNSIEFQSEIKQKTGWDVEMLPKDEEGRIGAMGVASSFLEVKGLVMDLGGGSTQITWMLAEDGDVRTADMAVSLPYGAAALTRRIEEARKTSSGLQDLRDEMSAKYRDAYKTLAISQELETAAENDGGLTLYLSGGGFRGWGYLLLSEHAIRPYPIPIINGFRVTSRDFENIHNVQIVAQQEDIFRVSERRASQVPAVAFLVEVITNALPKVKEVQFCQGKIRFSFFRRI